MTRSFRVKLILIVIVTFFIIPLFSACEKSDNLNGQSDTTVSVESVVLDKSSVYLKVGESVTLNVTINPDNATDKEVSWSCSNEVVSVDNGLVTALKEGNATVTVSTANEKVATCSVTVTGENQSEQTDGAQTPPQTSTPNPEHEQTAPESSETAPDLDTEQNPEIPGNTEQGTENSPEQEQSPSDTHEPDIDQEDDNKNHNSTPTPTPNEPTTETVAVSGVSVDKVELTLFVGEEFVINANISPDNATDKTVIWSSSDTTVATVENGKVSAISVGKSTVSVKTADGNYVASVSVTINAVSNLLYSQTEGGYEVSGFQGEIKEVTVLSEYNGKPVISIADGAFKSCKSLVCIRLSENIKRIGIDAFYGCSTLTSVITNNALELIDKQAFYGCEKLSKITVPENVSEIGEGAFKGCSQLNEVFFEKNIGWSVIDKDYNEIKIFKNHIVDVRNSAIMLKETYVDCIFVND